MTESDALRASGSSSIAVIPGDGIGTEVIRSARAVLDA